MYENAKSCVKKGQTMSNCFAYNAGVRQGENLSPLLFPIYLNDFDSFVRRNYKGFETLENEVHSTLNEGEVGTFLKLYVLLYADATIVLAESGGSADCFK